jgi:hypothetical protein
MRRTDIISAGVFLLLGLLAIFAVIPTYVAGGADDGDLSPAFMPYVAATLGTGAMALLLVARLVGRSADEEPAPLPKDSWYFLGAAAAVLAVAFVLMDFFGYLWGAAAIVAGFMSLARANLKVVVGTAIVFPLALWLLFAKLLGFPLP